MASSSFVKKDDSSLMAHLCRSRSPCSVSRTFATFLGVTQLQISSSVTGPELWRTGAGDLIGLMTGLIGLMTGLIGLMTSCSLLRVSKSIVVRSTADSSMAMFSPADRVLSGLALVLDYKI